MRARLSTMVLVLACAASGWADGPGTSSGITLIQAVGARAASMGEAYTAMTGEVFCLHYNPASLASLKGRQLSVLYQRGIADDSYWIAGAAFPSDLVTAAGSLLYYTTGEFDIENTYGETVSLKGQEDYVFTLNLAKSISPNASVGINVKALHSVLAEVFRADAVAFDAGTLVRLDMVENRTELYLGLAVLNLGTALKYREVSESLPTTIRIGAALFIHDKDNTFQLACDLVQRNDENTPRAQIGLEDVVAGFLSLRLGYKIADDPNHGEGDCGFGIVLNPIKLDYSIALLNELSPAQRITLTWIF
jgi:hypothetical protein